MPNRSQRHKIAIQGIDSTGEIQPARNPVVAIPLVDQTSTDNVADTYQFAAGTFTTPAGTGALTYSMQPQTGFSFNPATRTISWTKPTGNYNVIIYATNGEGRWVSDDFNIVVT